MSTDQLIKGARVSADSQRARRSDQLPIWQVSLFGLTSDPCQPFHYYGEPKAECTHAIPKVNDESVHWFDKEHEIYRQLADRGLVTLYS